MNLPHRQTTVTRYRLTIQIFTIWLILLTSACVAPATATPEATATQQLITATRTPAPTSTQTPTNTLTPTSTTLATETSPVAEPDNDLGSILAAHLVAEGQGWVASAERLLWTPDGGQSWNDITPTDDRDLIITNVFFLDIDRGWVVMIPTPGGEQEVLAVSLFHSQDGGETWQLNSFEADLHFGVFTGITDLRFNDSQHGWLVANQTASMNSSAADLYRTQDAGLTWQVSALPFNGPVNFITTEVGWTIGSCCTGAPYQLFRTTDGGFDWQQQLLAPNPVEGFDYHGYRLPVFFDEQDGLLAVTIRNEFYEAVEVGIYQTEDGGASWQLATTLIPTEMIEPGSSSWVQVQFLQPNTWLVAVGKALYVTRDAGEAWERLEQPDLPGWHYQLMFVNEQVGWSLVFKDNCGGDCLLLYKTSDGGATWEMPGEER